MNKTHRIGSNTRRSGRPTVAGFDRDGVAEDLLDLGAEGREVAIGPGGERLVQRLARRAQADPYFRSELAARPAAQECLRRRSRPAAMDARGAAGANQ